MNSILHEDKPHYDIGMKAIMALPLLLVFVGVFLTSDPDEAIGMFATAALMIAIYWAVFPRRYRILDSKVRIVLGGPLGFNIPFDTIEIARQPKGMAIGINFATSFSSKNAVEIVRKGKLNVNITPGNRELFLENMDRALESWRNQE